MDILAIKIFMRKFVATLSFVFASVLWCNAQTKIYTSEIVYCEFVDKNKGFTECNEWAEETVFVIDAKETKIDHLMDGETITYIVDKKIWNEEKQRYEWYLTDNKGTKYVYDYFSLHGVDYVYMIHEDSTGGFELTFKIK